MLTYVSGKYRDKTAEGIRANIALAREVGIKLWAAGHATITPHLNTINFEDDSGLSDEVYLDGDLTILARCDAIVMLENWTDSEGARHEHEYALARGIPVYYWPDYPELHPIEVRCPDQCEGFIDEVMSMYRVMLAKNMDYSASNILGTGEVGLVTRLWDKVARLMNLTGFRLQVESATFEKPKAPNNESIEDNLRDAANYAVIGQLLRAGKWGR